MEVKEENLNDPKSLNKLVANVGREHQKSQGSQGSRDNLGARDDDLENPNPENLNSPVAKEDDQKNQENIQEVKEDHLVSLVNQKNHACQGVREDDLKNQKSHACQVARDENRANQENQENKLIIAGTIKNILLKCF